MRAGELLALRWNDDLDLARGVASLAVAKAGPRSVALPPEAVEILRGLRARRVVGWDHVFAAPPIGKATFPRAAWDAAVEAAKLSDLRFHDLRHTFATYAVKAGATLMQLKAALGHASLASVARYAHHEDAAAAPVAAKVAERMSS
jgi:integrase